MSANTVNMTIHSICKTSIFVVVCFFSLISYMDTPFAATPKKRKIDARIAPLVISKTVATKTISKKSKSLALQPKCSLPLKNASKTKTTTQVKNKILQKQKVTIHITPEASIKLKPKIKTNIRAKSLLPLLATPISTPTPQPFTPRNISSVVSEFEQKLLKTFRDKHIPGCAVAIVYKNEIVLMNGYGVRTLGKPEKVDVDTVFQLGSVSKPIAATLTTLLENRGFLNVNDPVSRYLPNFSLNGVKNSEILKIKHVLSHSSGLPRSGFNHLIESFAPHSKLIRMLQTTRISAPIGKRYDYHNAMFSLISEITMAATRQSFQDSLSTHLLKPLNMNSTSASYEGLIRTTNRAFPHILNNKNKMAPAGTYSTGYYSVAPAGGINSSIRDMAIFLKAQLGGYPAVLDQASLTRLQQPLVATPGTSLGAVNGARDKIKNSYYGLGWRLIEFNQKKMVYHAGWVKGFKNFIAFIPEQQVGIVVLHNSETKFSPRLAMQFFDIFFSTPSKS